MNKKTNFINKLFLFSLFINFLLLYIVKVNYINLNSSEQEKIIEEIYNLNNYPSIFFENKNLKQRIEKIYNEYLEDRKTKKDKYYINGKIESYWKIKCINNIRKVAVLNSKIEIIENILNRMIVDDKQKQKIEALIEKNKYYEKLSDVSNFYAQFLTDEIYNNTLSTIE